VRGRHIRRRVGWSAVSWLLIAWLLAGSTGPTARAQVVPPNIVVIITDDQRAELMDRMPTVTSELVGHGMRFNRAFAVDPLCCPSRLSFLRGQYSHSTGMYNVQYQWGGFHYAHASALENQTLPVWLHQAGYFTAETGKYLNGYNKADWIPPGWDFWRGMMEPGYPPGKWSVSVQGAKQTPNAYSTDALADYAVQGIQASGSQPLFLWTAFYGPHNPSIPPPRYSSDALAPGCASVDVTSLPAFNEPAIDLVDHMTDKPRWIRSRGPYSPARIAELQASYKNQCRSLLADDDGVARILAALEVKDPGLLNTIIVFTSDQGVEDGEHQAEAKKVPWDGSSKLPFVVRADGLLGDVRSQNDDLILNIDLAPTVLALAGATGLPGCSAKNDVYATTCRARGGQFDGKSFSPLFTEQNYTPRTAFLIEHWDPTTVKGKVPIYCAVRTASGLLVRYFADAKNGPDWEGYDLTNDPNMLHSLVYSEKDGVARFRPGGQTLYDALRPQLVSLCNPLPPEYPPF
jgi:N-acetylglucosamine-6-sulfatase